MRVFKSILAFFIILSTAYSNDFNKELIIFGTSLAVFSYSLDNKVKKAVISNRGETLDELTSFFNEFGSPYVLSFPVLIYKMSESEKWKNISEEAFLAGILSASVVYPLKIISHRRRPDNSDKRSFPSGHTALSMAIFGTYAQGFSGFKKYMMYTIPVLVGFSRIYKNKHYFSDIINGGLIGIISIYISKKLNRFLKKDKINVLPVICLKKRDISLSLKIEF